MKEYLIQNRETYDRLAIEYENRKNNPEKNESKPSKSGLRLLSYFDDYSNLKVLEIGFGVGRVLKFFSEEGCQTIGVELSYKMAKIAQDSCPKSFIICQDINSIEFCDNQFHIIYMGAVIHLFPKEDASVLMKKVYSWLLRDGLLYINTTLHERGAEGYYPKVDYSDKYIRYRKYWTEEEFCSFIEKSGFKIVYKGYSCESNRKKTWMGLYCKKL